MGLNHSMDTMISKQDLLYETMEGLQRRVSSIDLHTFNQGKAINIIQNDITDLCKNEREMRKDITTLKNDRAKAAATISKLLEANNKLEQFLMNNNLRLVGYPESQVETPHQIVKDVLKDKFGMPYMEIEKAHRTGKSRQKLHARSYLKFYNTVARLKYLKRNLKLMKIKMTISLMI